ncbi:UDP-N-acetylmuramate dehydrogenase [Coxiella endosymbiont of Amblyomma nuttalli]|uniref:UDP-N-acetylmuramate dehydrogenase n=1 Tax=Coxiella endosymbiont of Amblyomma nuttalli TaxID=2749996 RepID=UPI001BA622E3|nr:UDP-N-acetylmuramate dehydrogenase [Coxiella endosymbiont of Amblyomma nuttalli]QTS83758.1 UDP-N-acetylenolpyruvoylglucosamine reductase [Coxiella endosymbiont of Amblyomma nuttalli]
MIRKKFSYLRGDLFYDHNLARYTSWRVGGDADRLYQPADLADLQNFLNQLPRHEPLTWLGLGSNVLIRDGGITGTVILTLNRLKEMKLFNREAKKIIIRVEAGVTCAKLAGFCANHGLESGAFFAGIPGTVGGALAMNAGAFGGETWRYAICVETISQRGAVYERVPNEFKIQYRQVEGLNNQFFVAGYFHFNQGNVVKAKEAIRILLRRRYASQPIGTYNCGSVFRNPPGDYAAQLIESSGLKKTRIGNAEVCAKHANFILNKGAAKAADIERLIYYVADRVYEVHGVRLIKEVHIIGRI